VLQVPLLLRSQGEQCHIEIEIKPGAEGEQAKTGDETYPVGENMTWALAGLSIVGVILNIKRSRAGFLLWCATNASWAIIDYRAGLYAQSVLFVVYFILAVWGFYAWKPKDGCFDKEKP
jgi:nicotinamide riboside transporter PnuC